MSLGNLNLASSNIEVKGGTLNITGGSVGANGELEIGGTGTLSLGGNLAVTGTLNLNDNASTNLAGNTIDASGGTLELAGSHGLDGITTDNNTTLQINNSANISRTNSGTSTVGSLTFSSQTGGSSSPSLSVSNMGLTVASATRVSGVSLSQNNGNLNFQNSPAFDNMSSLSVNGGELILQNGGTFDHSSVNFSASVFKPSGTVSVTSGGSFTLNDNSSIVLQGDTTLSQSGTASWPELDLGGKVLTLDNVNTFTIKKALNIANGESLSSRSTDLNLSNTVTIDNGGELSSGSGDVQISGALTLNGEIEQGGGILNLIQGGTVGATGRLDVRDSELKLGDNVSITGTLAANEDSQSVSYTHLTLPTICSV